MRKTQLLFLTGLLLSITTFSQVTVTNPTNTTPILNPTYPSLASAITALNTITAISGPVTITLVAGSPETAPVGGYAIQFAATTTTANNITIEGSNNTITSSATLTVGALNDAIFKLIGTDYITLQNFTMQENAANTVSTPATSNNMTEWGVALLYASVTNGAQNNTIQNNTISLNRGYSNSFGIYSNVTHTSNLVTVVSDIINNTTAPNSNNKVYGNNISNVNMGITFIGSNTAANQDVGNDIGGTSLATGNTITNWGGASAITAFVSNSGTSYCILINHQTSERVSFNTIISAVVSGTAVAFSGILKDYSVTAPTGTSISTISYNTVTLSSSFSSGFFRAIESRGIGVLMNTLTININNNNILNCIVSGTSSSTTIFGIFNTLAPGTLNINYNVIAGTGSTATTGGFTGIYNIGTVANAINITNNQIGNAGANAVTFSAATSGDITGIMNVAAASTTVLNITNNTIDRISAVSINNTYMIYQLGAAGLININNNAFGTTTGTLLTYSAAPAGNISGILNSGGGPTTTLNMNYNTIDGLSVVTCGNIILLQNLAGVGVAVNMEHNLLGSTTGMLITTSGAQSASFYGIYNVAGTSTTAVSLQYNDISGIVHSVVASCTHEYIRSSTAGASTIQSNNTFTNLNVNTSGSVIMISKGGAMIAGATSTISNNSIVGTFNKTSGTGSVTGYYANSTSANGSVTTVTGNNFSNVTVTADANITLFQNTDGVSSSNAPTGIYSGNIINNIAYQTGQFTGFYIDRGLGVNISSNVISNISGAGDNTPIYYGNLIGTGTLNINSNNITTITSSASSIRGIYGSSLNTTTTNIYSNTLTGFSAGGFNGLSAIVAASGTALNIYDNQISNLSTSSNGLPILNGISLGTHSIINVYNNKIYNLMGTGAVGSTAPPVTGISFTGGITVTAHNNFVSDLTATHANIIDAIRGISITSTTVNSTYNLYYNSIYINATSTGTNFGSSGIYHTTSATATTAALNMIDNIIVNTSTPKGTGITTAYRRSNGTLTNYVSTSDHNLFYAGIPSATRLIYYDGTNSDQTLSAYQTRVSTRDANSITAMPNFTSITDLHIVAPDCNVSNKGIPITGITTDIDLAARHASNPDIGADEFGGYSVITNAALASTSTNAINLVKGCDELGWTYYTDPADDSRYLFAINWDPSSVGDNVAAKATATVQIQVDAADFNVINATTGTWTMKRYWNVDLHGNPLTGFASVRFFYDPADTTATGNAAALFAASAPGTQEPSMWFKTVGTDFAGDAAHMNADKVLTSIGLVNVAAPGSKFNGVGYAEFNSIPSFSGGGYAAGVGPNTPLPVTFNYLRGVKQGSNHLLNWKVTSNSTPRVTLTLERSSDQRTFTGIYTITADAVRCQQQFDHADLVPLAGINYYRLRIVDADGKVTYSNIISLLNAVKGFEVMNIAPNPVTTGSFKLNVTSANASKINVIITDMQGRVIRQQNISVIAGYNSILMNVGKLAAGMYNIFAGNAEDKSKMIRFVKQ